MGPKTYLMSFCLFMAFLDAQSCSSSNRAAAAAKFHAESNNGVWWPPEDDIGNDRGRRQNGNQNPYQLPDLSNDPGVNGIATRGTSQTHNNNNEQPQITESRDEPKVSYEKSTTIDGGSSSSSHLIESSSTVPEENPSQDDDGMSHSPTTANHGLNLVHLSNKSITCNDGTPAGYYIRKSSSQGADENLWIIFLEGGWYCFDQRSCMNRWHRLNHLMSSSSWPNVKDVGGILSSDPNENPYWWNANHVFIPYCSSDTWSGRVRGNVNGNPFSFMGALIIDEVISSLVKTEGLNAESSVILAGSSAGGTGVMINLDHVEDLLKEEFGPSDRDRVKGITDSGWFIDKVPLYTAKVNCHDVILCPPEVSLRRGMDLWNARLPDSCQASHPDEPWACFFGYRIYPTLKASLFVFQWLFDEAQMIVNNVPTPAVRKEEWDYVYKVGDELKKTLMNVTNVFIPSCLAHTILTHRDWGRVEVNSVELTRALKCWESGGIIEESNFIPRRKSPQPYWNDNDQDSSLQTSGHRSLFRHGKVFGSSTPASLLLSSTTAFSDTNYDPALVSNDSRRNRRRHNRHRHNKSGNNSQNLRQNRRRRKKLEKRQKLQQQQQIPRSRHAKSPKRESVENGEILRSKKRNVEPTAIAQSTSPSGKKNKQKKRKRNRRWYTVCDAASPGGLTGGGGGPSTEIRLIEKCSWPQCNKSCPKLLNPLTGEEVDFKDLLRSFGLDLATMAKALGIDLATLNSMDHHVLLQMLTQNA